LTLTLALDARATRADVHAFVRTEGWRLEQTLPADRRHGFEQIWSAPDRPLTLHYVEHELAEQAYVVLRGPAADVAQRLRAALPGVDLSGALALARSARDAAEQTRAARCLAVLGPPSYDEQVMHALADLLQSDAATVRRQALTAIACLGWPGLRPLVVAVALADTEAGLRQYAQSIEHAFAEAAGESPEGC
jgi:hypothetical protein